jgi:hypothetical protein
VDGLNKTLNILNNNNDDDNDNNGGDDNNNNSNKLQAKIRNGDF